jgi:hypothetical protein
MEMKSKSIAWWEAMAISCCMNMMLISGAGAQNLKTEVSGVELTIEGCIEAEVGYGKIDYDDSGVNDEDSSDMTLATVELGLEAKINPFVLGHVLFLYEEEPDSDIEVDECAIYLSGDEKHPLYLSFGRQYVPFGYFESHFVSDPLTLELGETRETAAVAGYENALVNIFLGVFNGEVDEPDDSGGHIDDYVAGLTLTLTKDDFGSVAMGVSHIGNIAESDELTEKVATVDGTIEDKVPGYSLFVSMALKGKLFFEAELLGAGDYFKAGELSFDSGISYRPVAWNIEMAYALTDYLEMAVRFGGSTDGGDFLPEVQVGGCVSYNFIKNTGIAFELQSGEYENKDDFLTATGQLAVCF